jgi:hypothetical protein
MLLAVGYLKSIDVRTKISPDKVFNTCPHKKGQNLNLT